MFPFPPSVLEYKSKRPGKDNLKEKVSYVYLILAWVTLNR